MQRAGTLVDLEAKIDTSLVRTPPASTNDFKNRFSRAAPHLVARSRD